MNYKETHFNDLNILCYNDSKEPVELLYLSFDEVKHIKSAHSNIILKPFVTPYFDTKPARMIHCFTKN